MRLVQRDIFDRIVPVVEAEVLVASDERNFANCTLREVGLS